jgi:TP901 family phage tail tape measure protein
MALAETAELAVRISLKDNVSAGVGRLQRNLGGLSKSIGQVGKGFGQVGAGLTRAGLVVGGAAVTGIAAATKAYINFEDAFAGVIKTVDEAQLSAAGLTFEDLAQQFRDMATEIPIAATELAAIGETAGALGIRATDIEEFTRTVALLGTTTNLSTAEAAESLGKIGTILNLTGDEFEDFADILVNLGNKGASTESEMIEVTKRFAAAGRQAGLSTPEILAYASAITSAGAEPEAAGSSLSRLFGNLITETALATDKGKAFAKVTGKSFKDFSKIVKNDTNDAMLLFLDTLRDLDAFEQQKALKAVGITNVRDRNAILLLAETYDTNLVPAIKNANDATGALSEEAQKRFDTLASKIQLLKNNVLELAITFGEGVAPAIDKVTTKLTEFLQGSGNKSRIQALGKEVGDAIDSIDWNAVLTAADQFVGILKGALTFAKLMYDAFSALPGPIKEAVAGFVILNKLSGGLVGSGVGNIVGGLAGAGLQGLAARAPGVGRLFAQPVFVTNWPIGFGLGGGLGAGAGAAGAAGLGIAGSAIAGGTILGGAAGISLGAILGNKGFGKSNLLAAKGLTRAEIEAVKYYQADQQTQQLIFKRLGRQPEKRDFETGIAKLRDARLAGAITTPGTGKPQMGGRSLEDRDEARADQLAGIMERAVAAGFRPSAAAIEATLRRNEQHLVGVKAAVGTAGQQTAFAIRDSEPPPPRPPIVNVTTNVSVSSTSVVHKFVQVRRSGPTGGSRERSGPLEF